MALHTHRQKWDRVLIVSGIVARYLLLTALGVTLAVTCGLIDLRMGLLITTGVSILVPFAAWWEYTMKLGRRGF